MSFSTASLSIISRIQWIFPFAHVYNQKLGKFLPNSRYKSRGAVALRWVIAILSFLSISFHTSLILTKFLVWKHNGNANMIVFVHSVIVGLTFFLCSVLSITIHNFSDDIIFSVNSVITLQPNAITWNSSRKNYTWLNYLRASCVSVLSFSVFIMPVAPGYSDIFSNSHWLVNY